MSLPWFDQHRYIIVIIIVFVYCIVYQNSRSRFDLIRIRSFEKAITSFKDDSLVTSYKNYTVILYSLGKIILSLCQSCYSKA